MPEPKSNHLGLQLAAKPDDRRCQLTRYLVDAVIRNGNILLNVGPDRHGNIPETHAALLRGISGAWLAIVGDSVYGTRGGPWNPVDGQYGFHLQARR